ncbi:hypothetical protein Mapa_006382 [Marchantia paleacea]|nr:hypothetical protein Mapa_006382 [Marchantia paleacea]
MLFALFGWKSDYCTRNLVTNFSVVGTVAKFTNMKGQVRPHAVCRWIPLPREWLNA